jgi:dipeptidyl aminopeptidase/acylaminoacyl peptidase
VERELLNTLEDKTINHCKRGGAAIDQLRFRTQSQGATGFSINDAMKRLSKTDVLLVVTVCATVLGCIYYFLSTNRFERLPSGSRYYNLVAELMLAQPAAVSFSPNGKYILTKAELESGCFQLSVLDATTCAVVYTNVSTNSQRSLTWRPDSQAIAFQAICGLERPFFLWDLASGKTQPISAPTTKTALPPLRWDPAGKKLAFFAGDWRQGSLFVGEIGSSSKPVIIKEGISSTCDFVWSPDGRTIALIAASEPGAVLLIPIGPDKLQSSEIQMGADTIQSLSWSPDGKSIIAAARREGDQFFKLFEIDVTKTRARIVAEANGDISDPSYLQDGKAFVYHVLSEGVTRGFIHDEHNTSRIIGPTNGVVRITHSGPGGGSLYARFASFSHPPTLIEVAVDTGIATLRYSPPKSDEAICPEPQLVRIKSSDGTMIPAFHWRASSVNKPNGVVIEVHGGLHTQTFPTWEAYIRAFTKRGFDVIALNYRGSSGFGYAFEELGSETERIADVVAACNYAVEVLQVPSNRICLMGNSHGSSLIAAAAASQSVRAALLISWVGPAGTPKPPLSPHTKVVVFQGALDPFLSPQEASKAIGKLGFSRADTRIYSFDGEGHFFYNTKSWATVCWQLESIFSSP